MARAGLPFFADALRVVVPVLYAAGANAQPHSSTSPSPDDDAF